MAWNMTFAFYYSLISQPRDLDEAARVLRLTKWQRFWRLDVPSGMIPLVWNGMMSFGGGLVLPRRVGVHLGAATTITRCPASAPTPPRPIEQGNLGDVGIAIGVMIVLVIGVNFFFWRPLTAWAERFRVEESEAAEQPRSLVLDVLRRSHVPGQIARPFRPVGRALDRATRPFGLAEHPLAVSPDAASAPRDVFFAGVIATSSSTGRGGAGLRRATTRAWRVRVRVRARRGHVRQGHRRGRRRDR